MFLSELDGGFQLGGRGVVRRSENARTTTEKFGGTEKIRKFMKMQKNRSSEIFDDTQKISKFMKIRKSWTSEKFGGTEKI